MNKFELNSTSFSWTQDTVVSKGKRKQIFYQSFQNKKKTSSSDFQIFYVEFPTVSYMNI